MPISSCRSSRPRSARYSMGSGLKTEAYTSAIASVSAARRSRFVPVLARNRLLYLPEKAAPSRSSRRLELRTMIGRPVEVVEHVRQPAQDVRGEEGVLEELDDVRVVEADPVGVGVLAVVDVLEVVVVDEVEDAVRGDVPAAGDADVAEHVVVLGRAGHDLRGEVEAGRLAPEAPVAARRVDDALAELVEVARPSGSPWRCSRTRAGRSGSAARAPRAGPSGWRTRGPPPRPRRGGSAGARRPAPRAACPCARARS